MALLIQFLGSFLLLSRIFCSLFILKIYVCLSCLNFQLFSVLPATEINFAILPVFLMNGQIKRFTAIFSLLWRHYSKTNVFLLYRSFSLCSESVLHNHSWRFSVLNGDPFWELKKARSCPIFFAQIQQRNGKIWKVFCLKVVNRGKSCFLPSVDFLSRDEVSSCKKGEREKKI